MIRMASNIGLLEAWLLDETWRFMACCRNRGSTAQGSGMTGGHDLLLVTVVVLEV